MLDNKKMQCIELLIEGRKTKQDIAKIVGIHRTVVYDWLKDSEFIAELDKQLHEIRTQTEHKICGMANAVADELYNIALTSKDVRTRNSACQYILDRVLGKPTSTTSVNAVVSDNSETIDILAVFDNADISKKIEEKLM